MNLSEIYLNETSEEELALHNIAKMCTSYATSHFNDIKENYYDKEDELLAAGYNFDQAKYQLNILNFKISEIVPKEIFSDTYDLLKETSVEFDLNEQKDNKHGEYLTQYDTVVVFSMYYGHGFTKPQQVVSTIVHELRHALDKHKGHPLRREPVKDYPVNSMGEYERQSYEVNARMSQALEQTVAQFNHLYKRGKTLTDKEFMKAFQDNATFNFLSFLKEENPKAYQRLIKRAYDMYNTLISRISKS